MNRSVRIPIVGRLGTTGLVYVALVAIVVVAAVLVAFRGQNLFSESNVVDMLGRSSVLGFVAIGQTLVIICRSLDLSVGYVVALSSLVAATTMDGDPSRIPLGVLAVLLVAGLIGLVNGLAITKLRVNAFITTLGMGLIIKGYLDTRFQGPEGAVPAEFQLFGYMRIGVLPLSTLVMLAVAVLAIVLLRATRVGYHMYAVGGDTDVARMSGIRTDRTVITAHVFCAVTAGLAGLLLAARFGTGSGERVYRSGYELDSIAAVVLGGTNLLGGWGGVAGTIAGVLILAVLDSVFNLLAVNPFFKDVLRGVVVIAAVALYARHRFRRNADRDRFAGDGHPSTPRSGPGDPASATDPDPPPDGRPDPTGDVTSAEPGGRS
ncbi:ABC transporter permease [Spiractinospora alimapuensis]|uniref:ABC transporter permease n=1 Tax=Spiractinospora alimapuensis TaxID=2820884 RepID=UPI001F46EAFC|nr:ABC transporter permease [Spiractinospora alimapuensis]